MQAPMIGQAHAATPPATQIEHNVPRSTPRLVHVINARADPLTLSLDELDRRRLPRF
jgi:hypothetical protein